MTKNLFFPAIVVSVSIMFLSFAKANNSATHSSVSRDSSSADSALIIHETSQAEKLFNGLNLQSLGLSQTTVEYAIKGYQKLVDSGLVNNSQYLTIVDLSQSSRNKRFYIIDMENNQLAWNTFVAHGKNSGVDLAKSFSNNLNSNKSSLGFYVTKSTYTGKHGLSLRISGLEQGFNDNAEARGVVVHGATYVNSGRAKSDYMGRSQGCPALPENEYAEVIDIIKDGSVLFVYNPDSNYLQSSALLN